MADEGENHSLDWFGWAFLLLLLYGVLTRLLPSLQNLIERIQDGTAPAALVIANNIVLFILDILLVIAIAGITFVLFKMARLRKKKIEALLKIETTPVDGNEKRWQRILELASSQNSSDWKVAIIEADTILDGMVTTMGFAGDTLGEKLKNIEKSDFTTLDEAWEAHKFRNKIAHSDEPITQREAHRIVALYGQVFQEFEYI